MKRAFLIFFYVWGITCYLVAQQADTLALIDITHEVDYGHLEKRDVHTIIVHSNYYVGDDPYSIEGCLKQFRQYDVAPHYLIARDGQILKMVDEEKTAFHAGKSQLPGTEMVSLNQYSIGIELINTQKEPPTAAQVESLVKLVCDIRSRRPIRYLMRHSDVSPRRKTDPWCMDWKAFCQQIVNLSGDIIYKL